jgi:hypothetical protein
MEMSIHPAKCTMWCAISKQGLIGPIFVEGNITSQWYLQQLRNEVILVIQGAGHMNTTFFRQNGACPHTTNVVLDVLLDVLGNCVLSNKFPERFWCGWSWPPCSPDMNLYYYFLLGFLKDHMHHTNPCTVQELQAEIEAVAEEITGDMSRDTGDMSRNTVDNFVVCL